MKVLVLTVTVGQGHNQTARAIVDYLTEHSIECNMLDTLEYINPVLADSLEKGYLMSTKYLPRVYGEFYRIAEGRDTEKGARSLAKATNAVFSRKLINYLEASRPDVVACTHVYGAQLMTYITPKLSYKVKTVGIVTDFTIHPYWENTNNDYYITVSELLNNQGIKKGIPEKKLVPLGIPIHPKFANSIPAAEARERLGLPQKRTVLVMSGSMGYGKVTNVIKELDKSPLDFQMISICGANIRLQKSIDRITQKLTKDLFNTGYTTDVDLYMDASDCIVTKPGGLTTSEALAKGLPIIMINPIPGQEDRNAEFLLNNGAAMKITRTFPADEAIYQMFIRQRDATLDHAGSMTLSPINASSSRRIGTIASLRKPNSTRDVCEFIKQLAAE